MRPKKAAEDVPRGRENSMESDKLTPQKMAGVWFERLRENADPVRAAGAQRYFKHTIKTFGLTSARTRDFAGQAYAMIKGDWSVREAIDFCGIMLSNRYFDVKALGILVLERFKKDYPKSLFSTVKKWLEADLCDNWATVDTLCPTSLGALLEKHPDLVRPIKAWARSRNRWVRRASLVSYLKLARKPEFRDDIYEACGALFGDADDLVQKAGGWLLREVGKADPVRLERFLLANGPSISRTTLRYAIERFDEAKRRAILVSTRKR
jgi:3-methyladenine DNA glycosylase AlkD